MSARIFHTASAVVSSMLLLIASARLIALLTLEGSGRGWSPERRVYLAAALGEVLAIAAVAITVAFFVEGLSYAVRRLLINGWGAVSIIGVIWSFFCPSEPAAMEKLLWCTMLMFCLINSVAFLYKSSL